MRHAQLQMAMHLQQTSPRTSLAFAASTSTQASTMPCWAPLSYDVGSCSALSYKARLELMEENAAEYERCVQP